MTNFEQSLIEKIEYMLALGVGDISRLKSIEKSIIENKKIYNSDIRYVEELVKKNPSKLTQKFDEDHPSPKDKSCLVCSERIEESAKFCSFCGANQNKTISDFDEIDSSEINKKNIAVRTIFNFHAYQILAIIGGLAGLIPILIGILNIERIFELTEFYTGRDFASFDLAIISSAVVSYILCLLAIVISFLIKEPKKVGKFLIYLSFGILIFSILSGIAGFVIILFAGILALKKGVKK